MAAADDDVRAPGRAADLKHVSSNLLVQHIPLSRNLLAARHLCLFGALEVQRDPPRRNRLHSSDNDLILLPAEPVELALAFGLSQPLRNDLFGRLRRNAPEVFGRLIDHHRTFKLDVRLDAKGFLEGNLCNRIVD